MIIDTHCHLDFSEFDNDLDDVLRRAGEAGVGMFVNVGSSLQGSRRGSELAARYGNVFFTAGIHPHHADESGDADIAELEALARAGAVAVGEIGLDYYKNYSGRGAQDKLFRKQLGLGKKLGLPIVIHLRDSADDTLAVIKECIGQPVNGVIHCCSLDKEYLRKALDMGFMVSFTCNIMYKNAGVLRETASYTPLDRLMVETDAPFLSPPQTRGKRNEPANLPFLIEELARITSKPAVEIEDVTTKNAVSFFGLDKKRPAA